tara:strand:- start:27149 stop:27394 length:246 start_codon:yes stop_codon:yes gene_type:complete
MYRFLAGVFVGVAGLALAALVATEMDKEIKVGDTIQWEVNGSYQFPEPQEVKKIVQSDGGEAYLFVDGTKTGIPAAQAIKV